MALTRGQILINPEIVSGIATDGASIILLEGSNNGSNTVTIKAPNVLGADYTLILPGDDGTPNQVLQTDGSGTLTWTDLTATPAGSDTQVQYNNAGSLGASANFAWDNTNSRLDVTGDLQLKGAGELRFADGDSSNYISFASPATVGTNYDVILPDAIPTSTGTVLVVDSIVSGVATLIWDFPSLGTTQSPGGDADGSVQYNIGGTFTGETAFKYNQTTNTLSVDNISAGSVAVDNIAIDGNSITSTDTNGNIDLDANGTGVIRILDGASISFLDDDNTNFVNLTAPSSVTSNYTITLPAAGGAANEILQFDGSQNASFVSNTRTLNFVIDGGGSAITTGKKGVIVIDGDYTVTGWTIIADQSGSIVVDVNRATFTNFPTTSSIAGTELPTLSSAQKAEDLTLTSWTTTLSARDVIEFEVDSATTVTRVTVALRLVPR